MVKNKNWVDYKEIKERVSMEMVLDHYGLLGELKRSGRNIVGCCPIHKGSNPRQFSVNLERNIWNCFGNCKAGGNVLDFVAQMEGVLLREAALKLKEWFMSTETGERNPAKKEELVREEKEGQVEEVNPPLSFELKGLDPEHSFFRERGIKPETVKYFGLGYCDRGLMKGRIAIPIHNEKGELVAYCGRAVSQDQIKEEGKYKMPPKFVKSAVVYNLHRQKDRGELVLVESFLSVFWLYQASIPNVAALMGSSFSDRQEELILEALGPQGRAVLMFDGDEDGRACTNDCLNRLGRQLFVKAVDISPYGRKPHQLEPGVIKRLLG